MTHENSMKLKFQCPEIKFYWNRAILICVHIVNGCCHPVRKELSSCDRDHKAQKT